MFKTVNPYDEVIAKATDEKQTVENWDILLTVWDKVNDDGEAGARNCVSALQKRLSHRSANVQLFSLTLADALVNNCGASLHREISGKQFTQTLSRLVQDRTTHDSVKRKCLKVMQSWSKDHKNDSNFDLMIDTFDSLKDQPQLRRLLQSEDGPTASGSSQSAGASSSRRARDEEDLRKKEEEDLQRALAESAALAESSDKPQRRDAPFSPPASSSVVPKRNSDDPEYVRALYDFNGSSPDELSLRKGEVVKIVECIYAEWWKGELRGRVGIFPSSYVERTEKPRDDLRQSSVGSTQPLTEAEMEAQIFAQSAAIDRLLALMKEMEARDENPAENEELLDLYQQSMALRPKVVKLIEKYNQKQIELRALNDKFAMAKHSYDQMLEESLQRYRSPPQPNYPYGQPGPAPIHHQPPPQQHYGQPAPQHQQYGAYPSQHQQHPPQQQGPPAQAQGPAPMPQQHIPAQQQPQSAPAPQPQAQAQAPVQQGPDPAVLAQMTPEQRQEYERQWAEYQVALAQYYASIGQPVPATNGAAPQPHQQPHQRQGSINKPTEGHAPAASTSPAPSVQSTGVDRRTSYGWPQQPGAAPQPHQAPHAQQAINSGAIAAQSPPPTAAAGAPAQAPQPYWDGQSWVYPVQTNLATTPSSEIPTHIEHPQSHQAPQSHPPKHQQHQYAPGHDVGVEQQLNGPMAAMTVNANGQQPYGAAPYASGPAQGPGHAAYQPQQYGYPQQ